MREDPIIAELRTAREAYAREFGSDLRAIAQDLKKKEQGHLDRMVSYGPKPVPERKTA